jgi:hypothetical protein
MTDFNVRSDSVDVEQIMRQIRERIREKRGVDYTEAQIHELANAKLERFLDPSGVRSGLLEEFRRRPAPPAYAFEDTTLFDSDKAIVRFFRRLLRPFLKLLFNPNPLTSVLHTQAAINQQQEERHVLYYEVIHNLVVEMTRVSIESKNMKMRLESLQGRLEFNERRARALEAVVQYKRGAHASNRDEEAAGTEPQGGADPITGGESLRTRRRRRRRGRRAQGQPDVAGAGDEAGEDLHDASDDENARGGPDAGARTAEGGAGEGSRVQVTSGHLTITGRHEAGSGERARNAGFQEPAAGPIEPGGGSRAPAAGSEAPAAGSHEPDGGSRDRDSDPQ